MSYALKVEPRTLLGRRAKHVHDSDHVPGVMYGHGISPQAIQVSRAEFWKVYRDAGTSSLIDLLRDTQAPVKALIQAVQLHPISMEPYHVDFRQIRMDQPITIEVALQFVGESKAVKELAGTLMHPIKTVSIKCLPADLPHEIQVDLSALQTFEDAITVGNLQVPAGVTVLDDANITIATVVPPLTEEQLKKLEESQTGDVSAIKTEAEEKKAVEAAKQTEEAGADAEAGGKSKAAGK